MSAQKWKEYADKIIAKVPDSNSSFERVHLESEIRMAFLQCWHEGVNHGIESFCQKLGEERGKPHE